MRMINMNKKLYDTIKEFLLKSIPLILFYLLIIIISYLINKLELITTQSIILIGLELGLLINIVINKHRKISK